MKKNVILSAKAPKPIGPYSQATQIQNLIFTAGQIPLDPQTGNMVAGGIKEQTRRVLENLKAVLGEGGSSFEKVLKATVFLSDMNNFADMNSVYQEYMNFPHPPARSTIQVARLPKDSLVEIEVIAHL